MKKLTCPSCGGNLELPEHLTVAHCMYCGSKVAVSDDVGNERVSRARYVELLQVADEAGNHEDILHYANAILEIDPENALAWTQKGVATFWLTPPTIDGRLRAAMTYMDRAKALEPDNAQVRKAYNGLLRA
jgi:DNA-directed RNA polymerase subunit RPC12/RpoP